MIRIFLSYAREDYAAVRKLYERLKAAGYQPWMDKVDLLKGENFAKAIPKVIGKTDFFVVCLSTRSVAKRSFVQREINQALDLFEDEWFDFIYIDGYAHTGQEGGKTIHDWYKKLKRGGILAGDDYHPEWPLVVEQVNHFVRQHKLELLLTDQVEPDDSWSRYPTWATIKK